MSLALSLYVRQKNSQGDWRYGRVEQGRGKKTGKIAAPFYTRYSGITKNGSKGQIWHQLGAQSISEATTEVGQLETALEAKSKGLTVPELDGSTNQNRIPLSSAVATYLEQKSGKAKKTLSQYRLALDEFVAAVNIRFLDEVTENVLRSYSKFLVNQGYAGKTIDTRINIVFFLLKKNGIAVRLPKDEMPIVEREFAVPYDGEVLTELFAHCQETEVVNGKSYSGAGFGESLRYKFFLGSACRDQEVTYAAWSDIDFKNKTYHIRRKEDVGFNPKSHESRTVPLPGSLIDLLAARRKNAPHERWIFVNTKCEPELHFLRKLKATALRAGLNCGQCRTTISQWNHHKKKIVDASCKTHLVCEQFYLHRFRKTCATRWEQHGVPVRTIQYLMGHKDLNTTMIYLGITGNHELRNKIDAAFGD